LAGPTRTNQACLALEAKPDGRTWAAGVLHQRARFGDLSGSARAYCSRRLFVLTFSLAIPIAYRGEHFRAPVGVTTTDEERHLPS